MQHFLLSPLTNPITSYLLSPLLFTCYHQRHSRSRNNDVTIASPTHILSHTITHIPLTSLYHLLSPAICYHLFFSPVITSVTVVVATTTSPSLHPLTFSLTPSLTSLSPPSIICYHLLSVITSSFHLLSPASQS